MPIVISKEIPAFKILQEEKIFVMPEKKAIRQDIRPIEIAIVNLMPTKIETETQLMRLLGNSPLQINVTLISMGSYKSKNVSQQHMDKFYKSIKEIEGVHFDGLIVTGAPVENLEYEQVKYWEELKYIFDYAEKYVTSSVFICWGAQAAMKYYYNIDKIRLKNKMFGIYEYKTKVKHERLLKGMDDFFYIPMSRHTCIDSDAVRAEKSLIPLAENENGSDIAIAKSRDNKKFFFFGHSEYDRDTLDKEYKRDIIKGLNIEPPFNYYQDSKKQKIRCQWNSTANLLFYNWLNYYVYQVTPYQIESISCKMKSNTKK